jgi:hypothetical protein
VARVQEVEVVNPVRTEEEGFSNEQVSWLQRRQKGTWLGKLFPCPQRQGLT